MLIPAKVDLFALRGGTYDVDIHLYTDTAQTQPFPLTGQTVALEIDDVITLTAGAGLTIQAAQGLISVKLTDAQTRAAGPEVTRYRLKLTDSASPANVVFPIAGKFEFQRP